MSEEQTAGEAGTVTVEMPGEEVTATEIVRRAEGQPLTRATWEILSDDELRRTWRTAAALAQSGMFKDAGQAERAFAKILVGRDLGISPTQALMTIDLVEGAIQLRGVLLAGFLRQHPTYDYRLAEGHPTDAECTVTIERKRDGEWIDAGSWTFTVADAEKAKLIPGADKPKAAWNAHRKNMLMWRAIANAVRAHAPDLFGGVPVYVDDEIPKPAPSITEGTGDGSAPGVDLGPKVDAILKRAEKLGHAGLADRATAEMALMGQTPAVVERWCSEATAELDKLDGDADGEIAEADVVVTHEATVHNRVARCSCGWESPTLPRNDAAEEAGRAHVAKATAEPEPVEDPVEAANRAEVLREQAEEARQTAREADEAGDDEAAAEFTSVAEGLDAEADAIADAAQGSLDLGA